MDKKIKHLEFIQNTIDRMAGNLFYLRGWTVTIIGGLIALYSKDVNSIGNNKLLIVFLTLFLVVFWISDGLFLSFERRYRDLYDEVRGKDDKLIDFSMDTGKYAVLKKNTLIYSMFSSSLLVFYIPFIIASILIGIYF